MCCQGLAFWTNNKCAQECLLNSVIVWLDWIFLLQSLWAALHFLSRQDGSCPLLKQWNTHFLGAYKTYCGIFNCEMTENSAIKPGLWSLWRIALPVLQLGKEIHLWTEAYLCVSVIQAFISGIQAVFTTWWLSRGCRKTNKYASMHAYKHTSMHTRSLFRKQF